MVLLGYKKKGFGKGKLIGIGGKQEYGESIGQAANREFTEETSAVLNSPEQIGAVDFYFPELPEFENWNQRVIVFICEDWPSEILETEEIKPEWFSVKNLPWESMWDDYKYWLQLALERKSFTSEFLYNDEMKVQEYLVKPFEHEKNSERNGFK